MVNNELTHHGIKGMRWGVRRTKAQLAGGKGSPEINKLNKAKSHTESTKNMVDETKKVARSINNIRNVSNKVDLENMSDKELRDRVNRMNLEQQYSNLSANAKSKGHEYLTNTLEIAGSVLAITSSALAIALSIKGCKQGK